MSIPVICPGCSAKLNAPDAAAGKKVKCPRCQSAMLVPEALPEAAAFEVVDEPQPTKKPIAKVKADVLLDDDEADRPRKKKPALFDDDEDNEDDRPRKKKKKQAADNATMVRNIIGGVLLLVLVGVAGYIFYDRYQKNKETTEANNAAASNDDDARAVAPQAIRPLPNASGPAGGPGRPGPNQPGNPGVPGGGKKPQVIGTPGQPTTLTSPCRVQGHLPRPIHLRRHAAIHDDDKQGGHRPATAPFTSRSIPVALWLCVAAAVDLDAGMYARGEEESLRQGGENASRRGKGEKVKCSPGRPSWPAGGTGRRSQSRLLTSRSR